MPEAFIDITVGIDMFPILTFSLTLHVDSAFIYLSIGILNLGRTSYNHIILKVGFNYNRVSSSGESEYSLSLNRVIYELPFIKSPISEHHDSIAMSLVLLESPFVYITICIDEFASSMF